MAIVNQPRSFQFWNGISATPGDFNLDAGDYGLTLHMVTPGTGAQLRRLLPDGLGTNYVAVAAAIVADGYQFLQLPAGQYQLTLTGVAGLTGMIEKIHTGRAR